MECKQGILPTYRDPGRDRKRGLVRGRLLEPVQSASWTGRDDLEGEERRN